MRSLYGWAIIVLCVAVVVVGGYGFTHRPRDLRSGPDVRISMHMKDGHEGTCSGVYIGDGVVLTAKHCMPDDLESASVVFDNNGAADARPAIDATVLWKSDEADIAAYKLGHEPDVRSAKLACRDPKIGEPIEIVGNPLGFFFVHTWGRVAGLIRNQDDANSIVPIDAMIASGNSGGPVYDAIGYVLGLADLVYEPPQLFPGADGYLHPSGVVGHLNFMVSSQAACGMFGPK